MMKRVLVFSAVMAAFLCSFADCGGRYANRVFDSVVVTQRVQFGINKNSSGYMQKLFMDVYEPYGDEETARPVIMLAHGGAFIDVINQRSPDIVLLALDLAKRGYVVAAFDYREESNITALFDEERMVKAVLRSVQDGKAAIGFMKNNGIGENTWRIDPEQMILGGVSAGAIMALHLSYVKEMEQLTPQWQEWVTRIGGIQGTTGPPGYNSTILGLINISGGIGNANWVCSDPMPVLSIHGHLDPLVPYTVGKPLGIPTLPTLYGSYYVQHVADSMQYPHTLIDYPDRGHVPFMNITDFSEIDVTGGLESLFNQPILDSTYEQISRFCFGLIDCSNTPTPVAHNDTDPSPVIYPNPGKGNFTLRFSSQKPSYLEIINSSGQIVFHKSMSEKIEVNSQDWSAVPGIYAAILRDPANGTILANTKLIVN